MTSEGANSDSYRGGGGGGVVYDGLSRIQLNARPSAAKEEGQCFLRNDEAKETLALYFCDSRRASQTVRILLSRILNLACVQDDAARSDTWAVNSSHVLQ